MENYRTGAHRRFDIKCHFVWVTKYRKKVLTGAVGERVRDLVREVCRANEIEILQGAVEILQEVVDEQFQAASCWGLIPSMN